jgi:hypothetical protein
MPNQEHESDIDELSDTDRKQLTTIMDAVKEYQAANVKVQVQTTRRKNTNKLKSQNRCARPAHATLIRTH